MASSRRVRLCRAVAAALLGLLTLAVSGSASTAAAARTGNDVSWPQCSTSLGGYGLPMPSASAAFAVIGLNKGLPFAANPCLSGQVAWAASAHVPTQAYLIPAFPTAAQLSRYGADGPWAATSRSGRLANAGYAEATYALGRLAPARFSPAMLWVDVEARPQQPWPVGSQAREAENRAVITGVIRALDEAGRSYGFYSNASGWKTITGSWRSPGMPAWVTVGQRGAAAAAAACTTASFSSGPPYLAQWWDSEQDHDLVCPAGTVAPARPWPASGAHDLDGDWTADLLARDATTGALWLFPSGASPKQIGQGWQGMDLITAPGDLTGDGVPDVLARNGAGSVLWLYPRSRTVGWLPRRSLAGGWSGIDALIGVGDFDGDHLPDLLAREASTGQLWLYPGTGTGTLRTRIQVGNTWNAFDAILGPGDIDGDGNVDVLGRRSSDGSLWLYPGNGRGGWLPARQVGTHWGIFDTIAAVGDLSGNGAPAVIARETGTGRLRTYPTDGAGHWLPRIDQGTLWNTLDILA